MLKQDGKFIVPESSESLVNSLQEITSPMKTFVDNYMTDVIAGTKQKDLDLVEDCFYAYCEWCYLTNRQAGSDSIFSRNLQATESKIETCRPKLEDGSK